MEKGVIITGFRLLEFDYGVCDFFSDHLVVSDEKYTNILLF